MTDVVEPLLLLGVFWEWRLPSGYYVMPYVTGACCHIVTVTLSYQYVYVPICFM